MTELPTTFGKYYLTDKLATGGMAEIFLGKLIGPGGFEKSLVIKQIHPALSGQHHFVDLFVAEAKTLVTLAHGNIVPVYELGVVDDTYFIAMEYIDGPTLYRLTEAVIHRGDALAPPHAAWIAAEIAKGLDYAHRKGAGVIHRDLSPRNVMISRDGEVKLVDFGIAVGLGGGGEQGRDGMPTGSFPYMSPEQVAREPLSAQSDLFSLGVLLWEMLAGARLFARTTPEETLAAVTRAEVSPPSVHRPAVPTRLDEIVGRCLEREPAQRWPDAATLVAALQRYLYALEVPPGARELAALVARHCPPIVPRTGDDGAGSAPESGTQHASPDGSTDPGGPSTQIMRDEDRARGKPRKATVREASFATHVDLDVALGRATPLFPLRAILDDLEPAAEPAEPRTQVAARPTTAPVAAAAPVAATPPVAIPTPPVSAPAPRRWLLLAPLALVAVAAVWLATHDRPAPAVAPVDAAAPIDAAALDAAAVDAAGPVDAALDGPRTAEPPVRDAAATRPPVDSGGGAVAARTGRLKVGADPWGEVFVDGRRLGRAPNAWELPAGPHKVDVVLPGEDGELRRHFDVVITAGGEQAVFADFTDP